MPASSESIEEKIRMLPTDLREEAIRFIDELARKNRKAKKFSLSWAGGLSDQTGCMTSVELQHAALEWRECS